MKYFTFLTPIVFFCLCACVSTSSKSTDNQVYIHSLGDLKSQLSFEDPSKVLALYESQLRYRVNDPKQDFLHELNLGALSLLANQPIKSRKHFIKASQYIDWQNYTSILNETSEVLLLKPIQERYRLQPQEYLNLQYMQAMTYILEKDWQNALVSIRALHQTLHRLQMEMNDQPLTQSAFYYWFAGYVYEQNKLFDDARIDYEATKKLKPDWPHLDLQLWRVYAMTGDKEKEQESAQKVGLKAMSPIKRHEVAKKASLQFLFANNIGWQNWLNFRAADMHIERVVKGSTEMWGAKEVFLGLSRSELDREVAEKSPKKIDNPAYLLHVNPYSITYLVFGAVFSAYWDTIKPEGEPEFIVKNFEFTPASVSLLYMNPCWDEDASCKFKSYQARGINDFVFQSGNIYVVQFRNESNMIPFR